MGIGCFSAVLGRTDGHTCGKRLYYPVHDIPEHPAGHPSIHCGQRLVCDGALLPLSSSCRSTDHFSAQLKLINSVHCPASGLFIILITRKILHDASKDKLNTWLAASRYLPFGGPLQTASGDEVIFWVSYFERTSDAVGCILCLFLSSLSCTRHSLPLSQSRWATHPLRWVSAPSFPPPPKVIFPLTTFLWCWV